MSRADAPLAATAPLATLACAFGALAALVSAGSLGGADQWGVDHLMPGAHFGGGTPSLLDAVVPLRHEHWGSAFAVVTNLVTLPASALVSLAVVGAGCLVLARRGRRRAAFAWACAWGFGNAVEVLCKSVIARPQLHHDLLALRAFDSSFPSGHVLRTLLVAAVLATVAPSARVWLAAWASITIVVIQVAGWHTPSDIAGGAALASLVILAAHRAARAA